MKTLKNYVIGGVSLLLTVLVMYTSLFSVSKNNDDTKDNTEETEVVEYFNYGTAGVSSTILKITKDAVNSKNQLSYQPNDEILVQSSYETGTISESAIEPRVVEPVIEYKRKEVSKEYYVNASKLNCRKEPNTDSEIVDTFAINEKIGVTQKVTIYIDGDKQKYTWYKVKDKDGYVRSDYLTDEPVLEYLGDFRITYYCNCPICCDRWSYTTASGETTVEGVTCAADKSIPFGTKLLINGHVYTVQDRGGAINGNHIDIYMSSHEKALSQTYTRGPVYRVP